MMKRISRSLTICGLVAVLLSATAWSVSFVRGQEGGKQATAASAPKYKTLRERAQEQDVEWNVREGHHDREYGDLRRLAQDSDVIVLGRILKEESYFSTDNEITTEYEVDVQRVVKDGTLRAAQLSQSLGREAPAPLATPLRFTRFGGMVQVNGHRASAKVKGTELLTPGNTHLLFLQWTGYNYHIAGGMSGAVLVGDDSGVRPLGTNQTLRARKYEGLSLEAFIRAVLTGPAQ